MCMRGFFMKFLLIVFLFGFFLCNVNADPTVDSHAGSGSLGTSSDGTNNQGSALWSQGDGVIGFRVTLVDSSGKKVTGTRSVDFVNDSSDGKSLSSYGNFKLLYDTAYDKNIYKYRLSDRYGDANSSSEHIFYGANVIPHSTPSELNSASQKIISFLGTYLLDYSSNSMKCSSDWGMAGDCKTDFLTIFLRYSKYMTENSNTFRDLPSDKYSKLQDYYLDVEMLFTLGADGYGKFYGTGYEFLNAFYDAFSNNSYAGPNKGAFQHMTNNISDERPYFACAIFTNSSMVKTEGSDGSSMFTNYFDDTRSCIEGSIEKYFGGACRNFKIDGMEDLCYGCEWSWATDWGMKDLKNFKKNSDKAAAAVGVYSLADVVKSDGYIFNLDVCKSDFTTSFTANFAMNPNYYSLSDFFNQNNYLDSSQMVSCYDFVTFDYSKTISGDSDGSDGKSGLSGNILADSSFNTYPITAKITRNCVYDASSSYNMKDAISNDYNKTIRVYAYGNYYNFKYKGINTIGETSCSSEKCSVKGIYVVEYNLDNPIVINRSNIRNTIKYNTEYTGYIDFSNYKTLFGASNEFIKKFESSSNNSLCIDDTKNPGDSAYPYFNTSIDTSSKCLRTTASDGNNIFYSIKNSSDGSTGGKCNFTYKIEGDESEPAKFKFRTISLENPFPARDGTSRLPGSNWLKYDNRVFSYITNNRGIRYIMLSNNASPEAMYNNLEPMYTVTLTPATMIKIRGYNKDNDYNSMYTTSNSQYRLQCDSEGRKCASGFLRSGYVPDISGVCLITKNLSLTSAMFNVDKTIYPTEQSVSKYLNYMRANNVERYSISRDLNKNYRIDNEDLILSKESNHGKNTVFYTCANKTFMSGGPYYGEVDE